MAWSQLALRAILAAASLVLAAVTSTAASGPLWPAVLAVVVGTAYAAVRPDSIVVLALLAGHALYWVTLVPVPDDTSSWLALLAAAWLALLVHLAASAAVTWPQRAAVPGRAALRWAVRTAVVAVLTVPVWAVAMVITDRSLQGDVALSFAAFAGVALLGGAFYLMMRGQPGRAR